MDISQKRSIDQKEFSKKQFLSLKEQGLSASDSINEEHCGSTSTTPVSDDISEKTLPYLPPCRICNSPASGFHYGVNTCEACKGFFRRSLARKSPYAECLNGNICDLSYERRNVCPACRYRRCMELGMSKAAIKTGRYTHEKRTLDTLEIKNGAAADVSFIPTCSYKASPAAVSDNSESSVRMFKREAPQTAAGDENELEEALGDLLIAFKENFRDTAFMFEHENDIDRMISQMMKDRDITAIDHVMTAEGDGVEYELRRIKKITKQVEILRSFENLTSSVSGDSIVRHPDYIHAAKQLFECWSMNVDRFIFNAVRFAKCLPSFEDLSMADQIELIKAGRSEIASIVKFKHFKAKYKACIDYHTDTKAVYVFPFSVLNLLIHSENDNDSEEHKRVFQRVLFNLNKLNIKLSDLAVLCALIICTPDRDGLSNDGRTRVTVMQEKLLSVLKYSLKLTHPEDNQAFAKMLMVLPQLREIQEHNNRALAHSQKMLNPNLSLLLDEMLNPASSSRQPSEEDRASSKI